jgi:hypothetical protein
MNQDTVTWSIKRAGKWMLIIGDGCSPKVSIHLRAPSGFSGSSCVELMPRVEHLIFPGKTITSG